MDFRIRDRVVIVGGRFKGERGFVASRGWWFGLSVVIPGPRQGWNQRMVKVWKRNLRKDERAFDV